MSDVTIEKARSWVEIVVGPEEIVSKLPELGFANLDALLKANGLKEVPPLPSEEKLAAAKEQKKALVFRVGKDGSGKDIHLASLKEKFGGLIYSAWYLKPPHPFATEPLKTGWALTDLEPLPSSTDKTLKEQEEYAKTKGVRLKSAAADAYDLIAVFKATGKYFRGEAVNGRTATIVEEEPLKISHFDKSGMAVSRGWGKSVKSAEIGAATEIIFS
jgi:hypothetical protein